MAAATWRELDERRLGLPRRLSRAEMARRAGIAESTVTKGIKEDRSPRKEQREMVELVLAAEAEAIAAGLRS